MGAVALPFIVFTSLWGCVMFVFPIFVPKGPNKRITQVMLMITGFTCWLFWATCYIAQMNPLIGPRIDHEGILIMDFGWGGKISESLAKEQIPAP